MESQHDGITAENYEDKVLRFGTRQAGVGVVYDPFHDRFSYSAYCIETELLKEIFSVEHEFPEDAIALVNSEFGSWELTELHDKKKEGGCGSCAAKK